MKRNISVFLVLAGIIWMASATSCKYDQYLPPKEIIITDSVYFSADIMPIFNESCNSSGCHNTGGIKPDLSPGIAYGALQSGNYINTASPDDSELLEWMRGNRDSPMPLTGANTTYNSLVLAWIEQGAVNN